MKQDKKIKKRFVEHGWLDEAQCIDFLIEEVFKLKVRLTEIELDHLMHYRNYAKKCPCNKD